MTGRSRSGPSLSSETCCAKRLFLRSFISAALAVTRCSQVGNAERPSNESIFCQIVISASCMTSCASVSLRVICNATPYRRAPCSRRQSARASLSRDFKRVTKSGCIATDADFDKTRMRPRGKKFLVSVAVLCSVGMTSHTNRLIHEKSPYRQQHAHNPVDWYPWGPEAFERARKENKPIFLSIGYSTCHWCHVMEREIG